jgi:hypothetical protein
MDMQAKSKWSCIKCGVVIPYKPQYDMSNTLCSNCAAIIMPINYWVVIGRISGRDTHLEEEVLNSPKLNSEGISILLKEIVLPSSLTVFSHRSLPSKFLNQSHHGGFYNPGCLIFII